jgi:hypothetical protein
MCSMRHTSLVKWRRRLRSWTNFLKWKYSKLHKCCRSFLTQGEVLSLGISTAPCGTISATQITEVSSYCFQTIVSSNQIWHFRWKHSPHCLTIMSSYASEWQSYHGLCQSISPSYRLSQEDMSEADQRRLLRSLSSM